MRASLNTVRIKKGRMYYRLLLKQGVSLINLRHVREVALRGSVLTIYYPPITDGRGWSGYGWKNLQQEYTYTNDEDATTEFKKIQKFLESEKAPLG